MIAENVRKEDMNQITEGEREKEGYDRSITFSYFYYVAVL